MPNTPASTRSAPDLEILGDRVTIHPQGYVEPPARKHDSAPSSHDRNLVEHMARFRESPLDFLREVGLHVSGTGWRAYDDIVGQPIFYPGFSDNMKASVIATPTLQAKIRELAEKRLAVEESQGLLKSGDPACKKKREQRKKCIMTSLQEVVEVWTDGMICKLESKPFIRGAYYLCTQLLTRAYHQGEVS